MRALFLLWWLLWASAAQAQPTTVDLESISPAPTGEWDFEGGKFHLPETTVTSLPAASVSGRIYIVTDTHGTLCASSGGGTTRLICRDTGAAWEAIGSGGGGGGTECASAPCNLNASTTLNSKGICLADGTNCPGIATPTPTATSTTATATPTPTPTVTATNQSFACPTAADGSGGVHTVVDRYGQIVQSVGCKPTTTPTVTSTAATATPTPTATLTPILCPTNGNAGGLYGAHPEVCQVTPTPTTTPTPTLSATPTVTATATVSATPTPVACSAGTYDAVVGPDVGATCVPGSTPDGAGPTVGAGTPQPISTSTAMPGTSSNFARMDHVHVIADGSIGTNKLTTTGVSAASYTNANITVGVDGRITSASSGTNIPAAAALFVDKAGTDSASCGPLNAPCQTINGALAIIRTNNDNGFATCANDLTRGCGRCCSDSSCAASTTCNANGDCSGTSAQCVATVCQSGANSGKQCRSSADCAGGATCSAGATNSNACSSSTCTGGIKSYGIEIGDGQYIETLDGANSIPAPGYITLHGVSEGGTQLVDLDGTQCTVDVTGLTRVAFIDMGIGKLGDTYPTVCSTGNATQIGLYRVGLQHGGSGLDLAMEGPGNTTWVLKDITTYGFGDTSSSKSLRFEVWPGTCTIDTDRPCTSDADCTTGSGGTCDTTTRSGDLDVQRVFLQPGTETSAAAIEIAGKHCGYKFNEFFRDIYIIPGNSAEGAPGSVTRTGIKVVQDDCPTAEAPDAQEAQTYVRLANVQIDGGLANTSDPDVTLDVGANTTVRAEGSLNFDHCKRSISGSLLYAEPNTGVTNKFGGAPTELGVLNCTAPPNPINGECWYDAATDNRRECRINGSTVGLLTTDNMSVYDSTSCQLTGASTCGTTDNLSSTPTTILTLSTTWDNTGKTTEIHGQVQVTATAARTITCKLKNNGSQVESRSVDVDGSTATAVISLHYIETTSGTRGPYTLTCETNSGTAKGDATAGTLVRITSNVPSLATASSQIAGWLSDETGSGQLVFGTSPTITTPVIATGLTASGSASNDFSASTGTFKTSTGANTLSGAVTVTDATTPSITTASGKTNTGYVQVNGKTSGALKITAADAAAQTVTVNLAAQTSGASTQTIPDMAGVSDTFAFVSKTQTLTGKTLTDPTINAGGGVLVIPNSTSAGSTTTGRVSMDTDSGNDLVTVGDGTTAKPMRTCWREVATLDGQATSTTTYWTPGGKASSVFRELHKAYLGKKATFSNLTLVNRHDLANGKTMTCTLEAADSSCDPAVDGNDTSCSWSAVLTATLTGTTAKTEYKAVDTSSSSQDATTFYQFKVVTPDTGSFWAQCGVTICIDEEF